MDPKPESARTPISRRRAASRTAAFHFSPGEALSTSFSIFGRHLPVLLLLAAAFHALPLLLSIKQAEAVRDVLLEFRVTQEMPGTFRLLGGPIGIASLLASWILPLAFQAVVTIAVLQTLKGGSPRWGESVGKGVQRLLHALGAAFFVMLAIAVPCFVIVMVLGGLGGVIGMLLGFVGAAVLFVMLACVWYVAVPTAVVEGRNPFDAMGRSATLTRGARGKVFGIVLVVYGIPMLIVYLLQRLSFPDVDPTVANLTPLFVQAGLGIVFSSIQAVTAVVVYHLLRKGKEGVGLDELLAVFD